MLRVVASLFTHFVTTWDDAVVSLFSISRTWETLYLEFVQCVRTKDIMSVQILKLKFLLGPGMVVHIFNPKTQEAEVDGYRDSPVYTVRYCLRKQIKVPPKDKQAD